LRLTPCGRCASRQSHCQSPCCSNQKPRRQMNPRTTSSDARGRVAECQWHNWPGTAKISTQRASAVTAVQWLRAETGARAARQKRAVLVRLQDACLHLLPRQRPVPSEVRRVRAGQRRGHHPQGYPPVVRDDARVYRTSEARDNVVYWCSFSNPRDDDCCLLVLLQ